MAKPSKPFLAQGNGHQHANRRRAMEYVLRVIDGMTRIDDATVDFPPFGQCRFSAYSDQVGAMISSPNRDDNEFGSADWHGNDRLMLFRDFGDGRGVIYVCPIAKLFELRTIGHHGVRWEDVHKSAEFYKVFRFE